MNTATMEATGGTEYAGPIVAKILDNGEPEQMAFGRRVLMLAAGEAPLEVPEVLLYREDDRYRVEYMGITCLETHLERNPDGSWGSHHLPAREAGRKLAEYLLHEASINIEVID